MGVKEDKNMIESIPLPAAICTGVIILAGAGLYLSYWYIVSWPTWFWGLRGRSKNN
jgi:hypothetical protein